MNKSLIALALLVSVAAGQWNYDRHMLFDNSLTDETYYYSEGTVREPSMLKIINDKLPIDGSRAFTPPNSLQLRWRSVKGGSWEAAIHISKWRNQDIDFQGEYLSFWLFTEKPIPSEFLPRISIGDINGRRSPRVSFQQFLIIVPVGKWTNVQIPLFVFEQADPSGIGDSSTEPRKKQIKTIFFTQNRSDDVEHTLLIDCIKVDSGTDEEAPAPSTPTLLSATGYDRHVDLTWKSDPSEHIQHIVIYRSTDGNNYVPVGIQKGRFHRFADYTGQAGRTFFYRIKAVGPNYKESGLSEPVSAATKPMNDDDLLTMVQEACFRYYWESAHPRAGLALENIPGDENLIAVGASGFGIMAMIVGAERGFIGRDAFVAHLEKIVTFLEGADRFHGVWPHFLDGTTGKVIPLFGKHDNGGDLVETAFLLQGLLSARQYLSENHPKELSVRKRITALWESVEWSWYRRSPDSEFLFWHWSPEYEWVIDHPLIGWNETMIVYLLAIASPTHSVPSEMYYTGWAGQSERAVQYRRGWGQTTDGDHYFNGKTYYGLKLDVGVGPGGPLFFTHYSFMGFDPRGRRDQYTNYFTNNRAIALINQAYCIENPGRFVGYSDSCWGLTASDNPWGYMAHEPVKHRDNGTITPTGALASFPYVPDQSMKALKHFYYDHGRFLWGIYGFRDAFNLTEHWVAEIYMGLNQAPITVMIENYRTGLIWKLFMSNPEIQTALRNIGFREDLER